MNVFDDAAFSTRPIDHPCKYMSYHVWLGGTRRKAAAARRLKSVHSETLCICKRSINGTLQSRHTVKFWRENRGERLSEQCVPAVVMAR